MRPLTHRLRQFIRSRSGLIHLFWVLLGLALAQPLPAQVPWNFLGPAGAPARVVMLAADPRSDSVLYVVAPGGGVWKTTEGGGSWTPLTDAISSLQVCSVAIDPRAPDVLYLGTGDNQSPRPGQTVARSTDGGRTWAMGVRFTNQPVCALAVDPTNSSRVFAGSGEGLFISQDAGASWNKVNASPASSIAFDSQGIVYAGVLGQDSAGARDHVLTRSSDGGRTWTYISLPQNPYSSTLQTTWVNVTTNAVSVSAIILYQLPVPAGSSSSAQSRLSFIDFYRSVDGGTTWSAPVRVGEAHPPAQLLADPVSGNLFVAGNTLAASTNQGLSWSQIGTATGDFHGSVFTGGMLLLGGEKGLELVSLIQETAPRPIAQLPLGQFLGISLDSRGGVWAAGPGGLFGPISRNTPSNVPGIGAAGSVAATANAADIYTAGNGEVERSTNGGASFSSSSVIADGELRAPYPPLEVDPLNSASVYVAGTRLYHTTNSGQSWTALPVVDSGANQIVIALAIAPAQRGILYAATACLPEVALTSCPTTNSLIWRSVNSGQSWTQTGSVSGYVSRLAVDPRQSATVYAAIGAFAAGPSLTAGYIQGDLQQSINGGTAWTSIRTNLPNVPVNAVVIDPTSLPPLVFNLPTPGQPFFGPFIINQPAQTLYVATDAGVFVTFDLGGGGNNTPAPHWTDISWGLPPSPVTDVYLRQPDGILLAATFGRGVYSKSVTGLAAGVIANPFSIEVTLMQGTTTTAGVSLINISTASTLGWRLNAYDSWLSIPEPNGTLRPRTSGQPAVQISAAGLGTGTYVGRLQLVSGSFIQTMFVVTHVTGAPAQLAIVSGNNAVGAISTALPPLQVMVTDGNQNPLSGVPVSFAITTGGGSVSARTAFTNTAGIASTVLTLPANPGRIQLLVTSANLSVVFTASAFSAPALMADSVVDGVTFNAYTSLAPGSIISISGQNLSQATLISGPAPMPTVLEATRVLLNGETGDIALPLISISPAQVSVLLPTGLSPGAYTLRVETASIRSNEIQISVAPFAPGIFAQNGSGRGPGIFVKEDGSLVSASNPADRGTVVTFFAAGLGAVNPPVAAGRPGAIAEPYNRTLTVPRVFFDIYPADVIYSGLPAGAAWPYQVTVRIPALISPATNISVSLMIGGFGSNRVTIPVR